MLDITKKPRKKVEIPIIWDEACRGIPICVTTMNGIRRMANRKGCIVKIYANSTELKANLNGNHTVIVVGFESERFPIMLHELQMMGMRIVVTSMDADHIDSHYSCATFSRRIATEQMLDYLIDKGCNRFALVGCGGRSVNDMVHSDAMQKYLQKNRHPSTNQTFWYYTCILESFQSFFEERNSFDVVLCPNDYVAVAFLHFCELNHICVPEQLLLATFKGNLISQYCRPSITSLSVDFDAVGAQSVAVWLFYRTLMTKNYRFALSFQAE